MDELGFLKTLKNLDTAIKVFTDMEKREDGLKKSIESLELKASALSKTVNDLELRKNKLDSEIQFRFESKEKEVEIKINESIKKEAELSRLVEINVRKTSELDGAKESMEKEKTRYEQLLGEYTEKLNLVDEKQRKLAEAFNG